MCRPLVVSAEATFLAIPEENVPPGIVKVFHRQFRLDGDTLLGISGCFKDFEFKGLVGWSTATRALTDLDKVNGLLSETVYAYRVKFSKPPRHVNFREITDEFHAYSDAPFAAEITRSTKGPDAKLLSCDNFGV